MPPVFGVSPALDHVVQAAQAGQGQHRLHHIPHAPEERGELGYTHVLPVPVRKPVVDIRADKQRKIGGRRPVDFIAVAAVGQGCHEHIGRDHFTGVCVNNSGSIAGPVHLHNLTGLVVQVHGSVDLCQIVGIVLVELGGLVWNLARRPALVAVFQPQQVQRNTAALEFLVDMGVVRHLIDSVQ